MEFEDLISKFVEEWYKLNKLNLDIEITFGDGITHKISEDVEIVWNHDNISTCWNPF